MFVAPKNLKTNRLLKNRTINFDTPKRIEGNLVFILTDDREVFYNVLKSPLLRPQQMRCAYSPRIIRPLKRTPVRYDIANLFAEIKEKSNGKIMICKTMPTLYNGKNLAYDVTNEYKEVSRVAFATRSGKVASDMVRDAMRNSIIAHAKEVGYEKNYLIVPMDKYIDVNSIGQAVRQTGFTEPIPAILLLKDLLNGHLQDYSIFERIFFYNTEADVMLVIDPNSDETLKYFPDTLAKLNRMNKFAGKRDGETLTDDVEGAEAEDISDEDYTETLKQQIKDEVLKRVAKQLKAKNLTDFEEATKEEKVLALSIDNKIDEYLAKPDNVRRPFNDLVNEIDSDADVKSKAIAYVESKRSAAVKAATLSKALEKELAAIDKVSDIDVSEENIAPIDFGVDDKLDPSIAKSTLPAMDQEYNNKFLKNDLNNVFESFSQSSYYPSAIEDITYEDTSDDFNKKETASIRYKVDDGQTISFKLDIPTIVDDHYFYVGGNKYTIGKQMIRLPIVKTKSDRVEITASYQKMTIERRGSKVSRRNAYLMKILKAYDNPKVKVTQGDNSLINSSYKSDFEYEELSASLSKIESINITAIFNRQIMQEMIDATDLPENFIKDDMTPFAYDNGDGNYGIYYIKDVKVYHAITENNEVKIEEVSSNMFDFLLKKVLFLGANKLPSIGKSFIYTTVKFLTVTFPVFTLVGLMNGLSDILKRHKVVYQISEKKMIGDSRWVEVKFKDKYLYYEDKLENTLLLNALYIMDTEKYNYADFDTNVPYLAYLTEKLGQPMYAEGMLKINLDKMIDPITREILVELHQPTNIIDLLLLANNMLVNNSYQPLNDLKNYRIRGNEIVAAVAYGIVANAYKNYQQYKLNGRPESIKVGRTELINSLISLQNINTTSMLNPIQEIENSYACSAKGYKG